jgi:hypothetical protein
MEFRMKRLCLLSLALAACHAPHGAPSASPGGGGPSAANAATSTAAQPAVPVTPLRVIPATPPASGGGEPTAEARPDTPRMAEVKSIMRAHDEAVAAWSKASREAGADDAARNAWLQANPRPKDDEARAKLMALVQADPRDDAAWEALAWLSRQPMEADVARDLQLEHFAADERMAGEIAMLGRSGPAAVRLGNGPDGKPVAAAPAADRGWARLEALLARSPHKKVKGLVEWELAERTRREFEAGRGVALADVLARYTRIAAEYGDVVRGRRTLKETSEMAIRNLTVLAVGQPAPEIAGEDLAGVAFKLSDYRGKVVMLDFWGDW